MPVTLKSVLGVHIYKIFAMYNIFFYYIQQTYLSSILEIRKEKKIKRNNTNSGKKNTFMKKRNELRLHSHTLINRYYFFRGIDYIPFLIYNIIARPNYKYIYLHIVGHFVQ